MQKLPMENKKFHLYGTGQTGDHIAICVSALSPGGCENRVIMKRDHEILLNYSCSQDQNPTPALP